MTTTDTAKTKQNDLSKIRLWMQGIFLVATILIGLRHMMPGESSKGTKSVAALSHYRAYIKNHQPAELHHFDRRNWRFPDRWAGVLQLDVPAGHFAGRVGSMDAPFQRGE